MALTKPTGGEILPCRRGQIKRQDYILCLLSSSSWRTPHHPSPDTGTNFLHVIYLFTCIQHHCHHISIRTVKMKGKLLCSIPISLKKNEDIIFHTSNHKNLHVNPLDFLFVSKYHFFLGENKLEYIYKIQEVGNILGNYQKYQRQQYWKKATTGNSNPTTYVS